MILYFSGTGNSAYVAKRIASAIGDEALDLTGKIKSGDYGELHSERAWIIAAPTYAWRIPRILENRLERTRLSGSKEIYFVMTCGGDIGNAGKYLRELCDKKGMIYRGCFEIVMPENYIALFSTPDKEEALRIIGRAEPRIDRAIELIKKCEAFPEPTVSLSGRISSGVVNKLFYLMLVNAKKFYATEGCVSCGICAEKCPLNNIAIVNGKPVWGDNCTHCMACICRCPKEAIEYGKHSRGLIRYTCPK